MASSSNRFNRLGIISDTHGLLRSEVQIAFKGVDLILHAGDVGDPDVLRGLGRIAPVHAVRGNMDRGEIFEQLPSTQWVDEFGISIYLLHDLVLLDINPVASGVKIVVHGHTHRASIEQRQGVWYVNPGPAGRTFDRGRPGVALIEVRDGVIVPTIVQFSS